MTRKNSLVLLSVIVLCSVFLTAPALAQTGPQIILQASKESLTPGDPLTITVSLETGVGNQVNSFIASLKYPQDKLDFQTIDTDTSPFNMALEATGGNGQVKIIRGSVKSLTGKIFVGKVNFKAKSAVKSNVITVNNDSAIIRSSDNSNLLPGSKIQNQPGPRTQPSAHNIGSMQDLPGGFEGFIGRIKNFFFSFFK